MKLFFSFSYVLLNTFQRQGKGLENGPHAGFLFEFRLKGRKVRVVYGHIEVVIRGRHIVRPHQCPYRDKM